MAVLTPPTFIAKLDEIRRPVYIRATSSIQEERLIGFVFSIAAMASLDVSKRTMVIGKTIIWPNSNLALAKIKKQYRWLSERIMANNSFEVDTESCIYLDAKIKDPFIHVYEKVEQDSEYNVIIRITQSFIDLINQIKLGKAKEETIVLGNLSFIKRAKRITSINFYWKICRWQMATDQIALSPKEFLKAINSRSERLEIFRIKEKYINPIQNDLAQTSAAFSFTIATIANKNFLVFKFKSNQELNTYAKLSLKVTDPITGQ
jgi:hypothetical protein